MSDGEDYGGLLPLSLLWSLVAGAASVATYYAILSVAGSDSVALFSAISVGVFILIFRVYWNFRYQRWFLLCSIGFGLAHAGLIAVVRIPETHIPTLIFVFPLCLADFLLMLFTYWSVKARGSPAGPDTR